MKQTIYQVDAFTNQLFGGNPAGVCILNNWLDGEIMQKIALENNLSETAFCVKVEETYHIRWFTPSVEVDLCGHATLASAFVIFNYYEKGKTELKLFSERSGNLSVILCEDKLLTLNFPVDPIKEIETQEMLNKAIGLEPLKSFKGKTDFMLIYNSQSEIESIEPDFGILKKFAVRGVIVTAEGNDCDFVSRFFAPSSGIDEDPVTGSAHTSLTPFWANELSKNKMIAQQLSKRKGLITCEFLGDRVKISGKAVLYMKGEIYI